MLKLYRYSLVDINGESIIFSGYYISPRQAAFLAKREAESIPPCCGFRIHLCTFTAKDLLNKLPEKNLPAMASI